jgi:hypothetical protein
MIPDARRQRRWPRLRRRYKVTLGQSPSFSVDVGGGGFCTELLRVLPPGTPVEGVINVRGKELPFVGRVAWAKPGFPHLGVRGRMGVHFTRFTSGFPDAEREGDQRGADKPVG